MNAIRGDFGIYILANDSVFDQLVALLNSIEVNVSPDIPVCVIPYDRRLERTTAELARRPQVFLFEDEATLERWDRFAARVWSAHPRAKRIEPRRGWYGGHTHRRFAAFEGCFDRFVSFDADTLAMKPLDDLVCKLDRYSFVFDDWEHRKPTPVAALDIPLLESLGQFSEAEIRPKLHCGSFFGSHRDMFSPEDLEDLERRLIQENEVRWINGQGWWDDAFLSNYLTLWRDRPMFNYTLSSDARDRTGNCAGADPFVNIGNVLYNEDGLKPIHRIHYMNFPSSAFARLCQGEAVNVPYRDVFLHYRFLKEPEQCPKTFHPPTLPVVLHRQLLSNFKKIKKLTDFTDFSG